MPKDPCSIIDEYAGGVAGRYVARCRYLHDEGVGVGAGIGVPFKSEFQSFNVVHFGMGSSGLPSLHTEIGAPT